MSDSIYQAIMGIIGVESDSSLAPLSCGCTYYKCASITPGVSGAVIEVTGDTIYGCNGTYTIVDATATGKNRTWRTSDGVWEIRNTNATAGIDRWCIFDVASDTFKIRSVMSTVPDNPWEVTSWQNNTSPYAYPDLVLTPYDTAKTWSGYKAVFDSTAGTWSFESDATGGLTYTSVTPVVGGIYSADALARIQSLYQGEPSGLIFRAPLASDLVDIVGGVQGESWGTAPVYGQIDGKDCVTTNGTGIKFTFDSAGLFEDIWSPRTIMLWFRKTGGSGWKQIYSPADDINIREADSTVYYGRYNQESTVSISNNVWYHHAFTVTENNIKWYIDGVLKTSNTSWTPSSLLTYFTLATWTGTVGNSPDGAWSGQIADVRIYNRVLDSAEIQQIYAS